jgi:hypothetical protein
VVLKLLLNADSINDVPNVLFDYLKTVKNQVFESTHDISKFIIRKVNLPTF